MRINDQAGPSTVSLGKISQRTFGLLSCITALLLGACSGDDPDAGGTGGAGGGDVPTSTSTSSLTGTSTGPGASTRGAGAGVPSTSTATTGSSSSTGDPAGGTGGSSGTGDTHPKDHCVDGYDPHPTDAAMKDGSAEFSKNGQIDLTVQPEVINWMEENEWQAAHFEWHSIRRCTGGMGMSRVNICKSAVPVPADQECKSTGDGFQFLAMHRHMIQSLKQLWPKHSEQFEGFKKFPTTAEEVPQQWRSDFKPWSATTLANAKIGDEIDKPENLSRFPDEGALGMWLQCFAGQAIPGSNQQASGLHGDLHFKWVRPQNTDHGLGNQFTNIDNYMFWKLHGWIDNVWEKYRVAKGMSPTDQKLKDAVAAQCYEMDAIAQVINPDLATDPDPGDPCPRSPASSTRPSVRSSRARSTSAAVATLRRRPVPGPVCRSAATLARRTSSRASSTRRPRAVGVRSWSRKPGPELALPLRSQDGRERRMQAFRRRHLPDGASCRRPRTASRA